MELEMDNHSQPSSSGSSPPDTPIITPLSSYPTGSLQSLSGISNCTSPHVGSPPVSAFDTIVLPSHSQHVHAFPPSIGGRPTISTVPEAFNGYSGYSDYSSCMPGTPCHHHLHMKTRPKLPTRSASLVVLLDVFPLRFSIRAPTTLPQARLAPLVSRLPHLVHHTLTRYLAARLLHRRLWLVRLIYPPPLPVPALLCLDLLPPCSCQNLFVGPKPNCNKSYKQANGLKYPYDTRKLQFCAS